MRVVALLILLLLGAPSAYAQKLYTPVKLITDAEACGSLPALKQREILRAQQRTERLEALQGLDGWMPEGGAAKCFTAQVGKYMFFEGYTGDYACMRPRPGADCIWLRRQALGEIYELFPGRKLEQGNKGVTCEAWARAAQQASDNLERDRKTIFAGTPRNLGEQFAQGMIKDTLNMLTGSPNAAQQNKSQMCLFRLRSLQETGRRLTAYNNCPKIDVSGQKEKLQVNYDAEIRSVRECL